MKVLILSDLNSVHTKKWISALAQKKVEIVGFGLSHVKDDFYKSIPNVQVYTSEFNDLATKGGFSKLAYLKVIKQLKSIYKSFKPDIVHAHYATSYGLLGSFLKHKPFFISVWGTDVYEFPKKSILHQWLLKRNLRKATHLFSTSHDMATETKLYSSKLINVVPFGVDISKFKPLNKKTSPQTITIGIVKALEEVYGITYLISAFKIIQNKYPNVQLTIIGTGSKEKELKQQVEDLNLVNVHFLGRIIHDEVPVAFSKMDIVVIPSLQESFGVAAVEALACEKAVVASNVGGLPEIILDQKTGYLCPPKSIDCLAEKIQNLIANDSLRQQLASNGRALVLKNYDWNNNVNLMIEHYKKAIL